MEIKNQIRKENKLRRRNLADAEVKKSSSIIVDKIKNQMIYQKSHVILAYSSIQNEVDLSELIEDALYSNKKVFLPRVIGDDINFYMISNLDDYKNLSIGSFGISEPDISEKKSFDCLIDEDISGVVLVPGIAFSGKGQRIGFGKGFYDRFLSKYMSLYKIGICYDWQLTDEFVSEEQDIDMNMVITDNKEVFIDDKLRDNM